MEETELQVQSGGDGDEEEEEEEEEGPEPRVHVEGDSEEEVHPFRAMVKSEAEYGTCVSEDSLGISRGEAFLGPEWFPDDVSVTTACTAHTHDFENGRFEEWCAPRESELPEEHALGFYHPNGRAAAIAAEIMRNWNLVLITPYFTYNWIVPVSTTLSQWHTSQDVLSS